MQTTNSVAARTQGNIANAEPLKLTKRIGSTTYIINVYNGVASHDKLEDKVLRLIMGEVERTTSPSSHKVGSCMLSIQSATTTQSPSCVQGKSSTQIATPTPKSAQMGVKDSA